ncbi:MAG: trehalase family glycosidase [Bryobacteraceae bacterium]
MFGTRRSFVGGALGVAATWRTGWADAAPPTAAGRAFAAAIGEKTWTDLRQRLATVNADIRAHGLRTIPGVEATLLTGYPYNEFYDWDLYFENLYLSYYGVWTYCFTNLREFLDRQQPDGYVNRSLIKQRDRQHFKPFLAQLVVLGCRQNQNDFEWVRGNYYERLGKYLTKWFSYDGDHNGLPVWNSADAAGTDNQWSRGGALGAFEIEGVDLASYLVRELRAMAVIAHQLGLAGDVKRYNDHAEHLIKLIDATFWDEADGMYYDRNEKTGKLVKVKSATCFMPLFAGAATPDRARRTVGEHLLNEKEFWLAYPVASYAKTEPDYYQGSHNECNWRGPTWAPTNYMIFHGLMRYGFAAEAKILADRLLEMAVEKNAALREYYDAETGLGLGQTRFWGFTALYYGMRLEWQLRYDASSLDKRIEPIVARDLGVAFEG